MLHALRQPVQQALSPCWREAGHQWADVVRYAWRRAWRCAWRCPHSPSPCGRGAGGGAECLSTTSQHHPSDRITHRSTPLAPAVETARYACRMASPPPTSDRARLPRLPWRRARRACLRPRLSRIRPPDRPPPGTPRALRRRKLGSPTRTHADARASHPTPSPLSVGHEALATTHLVANAPLGMRRK
jgi:hypothetical protein